MKISIVLILLVANISLFANSVLGDLTTRLDKCVNFEKEVKENKALDYSLFKILNKEVKQKDNYIYPKAQNIIDSLDGTNTVFYYHNEKRKNQALDRCYINNSSSFITLYRNIMDTLEFQEYLEQKSKIIFS